MITINADKLSDGLYQIQDGQIHKYKAKGGTVRTYEMGEIRQEDFATLCICAIRYCHGRKTYMPRIVMEIVGRHLSELSDRDIKVMYDDCRTENLKAMCAPCHLKYDAQHHAETRRKNNDKNTRSEEMDRRRNQGDVSG